VLTRRTFLASAAALAGCSSKPPRITFLSNDRLMSVNLDGSDLRDIGPRWYAWTPDAFKGSDKYAFELSPDGKRVAYHFPNGAGYAVSTADVDGQNRRVVANERGRLFFGPAWSPDGSRIVFQDCDANDVSHDWADLCIVQADGTGLRRLTTGRALWFGASWGNAQRHGTGSNIPKFTPDGQVLVSLRLPGSVVPWEYQAGRPDTDHFNREFKRDQARGGARIAALDPRTGATVDLTPPTSGVWDFRSLASPDGRLIAFCRAKVGELPALWLMGRDGSGARLIARMEQGLDHPRWLV